MSQPITRIVRCMSNSIGSTKEAARKAAKAALRNLTAEQMARDSHAINTHLASTGLIDKSTHITIYVHCPALREVDTTPILHYALQQAPPSAGRHPRRIYAPRVLDSDSNMHFLHFNSLEELEYVPPFGIREPPTTYPDGAHREDILESNSPVDLIIMPGLAFSLSGKRLGRGGGYYDKFIDACRRRASHKGWGPPLLVALAFQAQIVDDVPMDEHDEVVDVLVTEDGVHACSEKGKKGLQMEI